MVTEAGTTGDRERGRPQTSQFSEWPGGRGEDVGREDSHSNFSQWAGGSGEGVGRGTSHQNFSQWAGATATDDRRVMGEEDAGFAQWVAEERINSVAPSQHQPQSSSREANNQQLEMFDVTW